MADYDYLYSYPGESVGGGAPVPGPGPAPYQVGEEGSNIFYDPSTGMYQQGGARYGQASQAEQRNYLEEQWRDKNGGMFWGRSPDAFYGDVVHQQNMQEGARNQAAQYEAERSWALGQSQEDRQRALEARQMQAAQAGRLAAMATGQAPSLAAQQYQNFLNQSMAAQRSAAASTRGGNALAAQRAAAAQGAQMQVQAVGQQAELGLRERMAAEDALGGLSGQMRGQDYAGAQGALAQGGQALQGATMQYGREQSRLNAEQDVKKSQLQSEMSNYAAVRGQEAAKLAAENQRRGFFDYAAPVVGAGLMAGGMAASDERVKTDISDGRAAVRKMLDSLASKSYRYRTPESPADAGPKVGLLAQDLEVSPAGSTLVSQRPDGVKVVNVPGAAMASLAAVADVHNRVRRLEERTVAEHGKPTRGHR